MFNKKISQNFDLVLENYRGINYSRRVFLFPGQGEIKATEYKPYLRYSAVQAVFAEADQLANGLGLPSLSDLVFANSSQIAGSTLEGCLQRNLFLLTIQTAIFRFLNSIGFEPSILSSHSFGEFAALHCAGVYDFETAFKIVALREQCTPLPGELGTLVAASCSRGDFEVLSLSSRYEIANINSPRQLVLACPRGSVKGVLNTLRKNRIAAKELGAVGRPYHSSLLQPHSEKFRSELRKMSITPGELEFGHVSSISTRYYEQGFLFNKESFCDFLSSQLTHPVDFREQIKQIENLGINSYLEISSGSTLSALTQANLEGSQTCSVASVHALLCKDELVEENRVKFDISDSLLLKKVSQFVSKVTGYSIDQISIKQKFEDDLRIDSIKKAEILFHALEDNNLGSEKGFELSKLRYVGDLVQYIEERKKSSQSVETQEDADFYILRRTFFETGFPSKSAEIKSVSEEIDTFSISDVMSRRSIENHRMILNLEGGQLAQILSYAEGLVELIEHYLKDHSYLEIALLSKEITNFHQSIHSFLLSLRKEHLRFSVKSIIVSDTAVSQGGVNRLLKDPLVTSCEAVEEKLLSQSFEPIDIDNLFVTRPLNILSIGGSSGLLKHYLSRSKTLSGGSLVFLGRSGEDSSKVLMAKKELENNFNEIRYLQCDCTDKEKVYQVLCSLKESDFYPDLVFDASGAEVSLLYKDKSKSDIESEFMSKVVVFDHLTKVSEEIDFPLGKIIQFNSIASRYGNQGQTIYGLTDGYSLVRPCNHVVLPALYKLGMTENLGILQKLEASGVDLLPQQRFVELLDLCVSDILLEDKNKIFEFLSMKDHFILQMQLLDQNFVDDIFGQVNLFPNLSVARVLDKQKMSFLKDHTISSQCIAPGCLGLATMFFLAKIFFNRSPEVKDFQLKSLIPLEAGPVETHVEVNELTPDRISFSTHSKVENYTGTFLNSHLKPSVKCDFTDAPAYDFNMNEFYSAAYGNYGPSFQILDRLQVTSQGMCLAEHRNYRGEAMSEYEDFDRFARIVEGVFQTAGFLATWHDQVSLVPVKVGRLICHQSSVSDHFFLKSSMFKKVSAPERWMTDVFVYNDLGMLCFSFLGVEGMRIKQYRDCPVSYQNILQDPEKWITMLLS